MTEHEKIQKHICIYCGYLDMKYSEYGNHQDCPACGTHYWFRDDDNSWRDNGPSDDYKWAMLGFDIVDKYQKMSISELISYLKERTRIK